MSIQFFRILPRQLAVVLILISLTGAAGILGLYVQSFRSIDQSQKAQLANYICKLIEPRLQIGAFRDVEDFLNSASQGIDKNLYPFIVLNVNGEDKPIGPVIESSEIVHRCQFSGISNVAIEFHFHAEKKSTNLLALIFATTFGLLLSLLFGIVWLANRIQHVFSQVVSHLIRSEFSSDESHIGSPPMVQGLLRILKVDSSVLSNLKFQFANLKTVIENQNIKLVEKSRVDALVSMASQVSHDIRSPLSALNMVVSSIRELPEEKRLIIRNASQRINDIANSLLSQAKTANAGNTNSSSPAATVGSLLPAEPVMLVSLLDSIISEKRIQFRERMDIEIQGDLNKGYGLFARVNGSELSRVISNLINNSVEAFTGPGRVTVAIRGYTDQVAVIVSDNGKGIPPEVLARLGERGVTHGKEGTSSGSGLGVYHARETIEKAGGKFSIQSQIGMGTMITLTLPRAESPKWFVEKISLTHGTCLVSADDDQTIHQIWSGRLPSAGSAKANIEHLTFSSLEQFEAWVNTHKSDSHKYLVDYEFLGQAGNGLDVVERLGIAKQAILVTSRYEEKNVRDRAADMGIRILPKTLAPFVPLKIEAPREKYDAVLLDDDSLITMTWQMAAKESGKTLLCFSTPEEFYLNASKIHPESPLYIDVNLGDGIRGEEVAVKASCLGFKNIYLATGYEASAITPPACVRKVVGKDPVF
jgi:signal transduction histidine kinase